MSQISSRPNVDGILNCLQAGVCSLSQFVENINDIFEVDRSILDIETFLRPSIEKSQREFDNAKNQTEVLLNQINYEFENSVEQIKITTDKIKGIQGELESLLSQLQGKETVFQNANKQHEKKIKDLKMAEDAVTVAVRNLYDLKISQKNTFVTGSSTALVSLFAFFVFPPAAFGVVAGIGACAVSLTAMEEAVKDRRYLCDTARDEVASSKTSLEKARNQLDEIKKQHNNLNENKKTADIILLKLKKKEEDIRSSQKNIIEINENIKRCYSSLRLFYGRFNVLHCETDGCYSLVSLQFPTSTVCESLITFLQCPPLKYFCDHYRLLTMTDKVQKIKTIEWRSDSNEINDLI